MQGAALKATMDEKQLEKDKHQMTFLQGIVAHPTKGLKQSTGIGASRQFSVIARNGTRTKVATGKSVMDKVRREAREARLFTARNSALALPLQRLNNKDLQTRKMPEILGHIGREESRPSTTQVNVTRNRRNDAPISMATPANGIARLPQGSYQNLTSAPNEKSTFSSAVPLLPERMQNAVQMRPIGKKRAAGPILMASKRSRI